MLARYRLFEKFRYCFQISVAALFMVVWVLGADLLFHTAFPAMAAAENAGGKPSTKQRSASSEFERARAEYLALAAKDQEVRDLAQWERVATRFSRLIERSPESAFVPQALYLLGQLYEQTFRKRQFRTGLSKSMYFYERLAKDFSGNTIVPEALLRLGDLRREGLKDEPAARSAYFEIVDRYPQSDSVRAAKERLGPLGQDTASATTEVASESEEGGTGLFSLFGSGGVPAEGGREVFRDGKDLPRPTIVIDPGHGGEELGAVGVDGLLEKDVVLQISLLLEELLRDRLRARTVLTRTSDVTLSLADRSRIANEQKADLFISVHANASEYRTLKGIETYYLDNTNDKASLKLAKRENASLMQSGTDLGFIISDFIQNAKLDESISLAHHLHDNLLQNLSRYYSGVKDLGVKKAPFYVLVGAHMPCALVEVSFIDHPAEGARLASKRYQKLIATGLYLGIKNYFEQRAKES